MKNFILITLSIFFGLNIYSQAPEKFTYQSIVRYSDGSLLKSSNLGIKISILKNSDEGASVYTETHSVTTNRNGLVTLTIGNGVSGDNISDIDWSSGSYYLMVEVDPNGGIGYTIEQTAQLLSVPYALFAGNSTIDLDKDKEPDIYKAIRRDALLENVTVNENGSVDYSDTSVTQNTRVSYPIYHIDNIVKPISKGQHASKIIFLTADAFGVLPAVSKLSYEQAEYHFLSGFTAKLAGTERGVTEPQPAFSACYGAAFLMLHPTKYSNVLSKKMKANNSEVFLVNTGWNGKGERISLKNTRLIIDSILNNELDEVDLQNIPIFNLKVPTKVKNIPSELLDPRSTWSSNEAWDKKANELAKLFINNFEKFCDNDHGKKLLASGPQI